MSVKYGRKCPYGENMYDFKLFDTLEQAQDPKFKCIGPIYEVIATHKCIKETREFWVKEEVK